MAKRIEFPSHLLNQTHATIRYAFDHTGSNGIFNMARDGDEGGVANLILHTLPPDVDTGRFDENKLASTLARILCQAASNIEEHGNMGYINITSITTRIIQEAGRYVNSWASDALYGLDHIRELCENEYPLQEDIDEIFVFGLRRNGVDHGNYVMHEMSKDLNPFNPYLRAQPYYRKVLAVRVTISANRNENGVPLSKPRVTCELKDLTDAFLRLNDADKGPDGKVMMAPFEGGNPVPVDPYPKKAEPKVTAASEEKTGGEKPNEEKAGSGDE